MDYTGIIVAIVLVAVIILVILTRMIYTIQPYQQGIVTLLGSYKRMINPGFNLVSPLATVLKIDLRTQVLEVPRQEVITKDNSPTNVDAIIYIKVVDAPKAIFQVQNYQVATLALAQTTLRSIIGDMELDEVLYNRERINTRLRDILDESTDKWGVRVDAVEIKEVDPVGPVKTAMEEQTSAERQRRAAVLRADGEKRSAILVAEGQKRSRILQAEGVRQSQILEAEGARVATILRRRERPSVCASFPWGRASSMPRPSPSSRSIRSRTSAMARRRRSSSRSNSRGSWRARPSTSAAAAPVPDRQLNTLDDLEKRIGSMDDILGPIPKQEELLSEIRSIEEEIKAESDESSAIVNPHGSKTKVGASQGLPDADQFAPPPPPGPAAEHTGSAPPTIPPANSGSVPDQPPRRPRPPPT